MPSGNCIVGVGCAARGIKRRSRILKRACPLWQGIKLPCTGELNQDAIASGLYHAPLVVIDLRLEHLPAQGLDPRQGSFLVLPHQGGEAHQPRGSPQGAFGSSDPQESPFYSAMQVSRDDRASPDALRPEAVWWHLSAASGLRGSESAPASSALQYRKLSSIQALTCCPVVFAAECRSFANPKGPKCGFCGARLSTLYK